MATKINNPFETSFENLSTMAGQGVKQVKKQSSQAAQAVVGDVKQQVLGDNGNPKSESSKFETNPTLMQQLGLKPMPQEQKQDTSQKQQEQLSQTRQNIEKLNREIEEVRRANLKKQETRNKQEQQTKQEKRVEEKKKQEDPFWKKALRGKTGSQEAAKTVSG